MSRLDPGRVGSKDSPTLQEKETVGFSVTPDVERILQTPATNEFNPDINKSPTPDPVARTYAARARERLVGNQLPADFLKTKKVPLGHAPPLPKGKMEAIAGMRMPQPAFEEPSPEATTTRPPPPMQGVGAAYEVNRAMAEGRLDRPVSLREANKMEQNKKPLSPETVQAIQMANENMRAQSQVDGGKPVEDQRAEQEVASAIKAQAPVTNPAQTSPRELDDAEKVIVEDRPSDDRPMPFDLGGDVSDIRSKLMNPARRKKIESRLSELDLADMILKREISQDIPIVPAKLAIQLRTFTQKENLWCLQYIFDFPGSALYTRELLSTCQIVCSLVSINGRLLPDHRDNVGQPNETIDRKAFEKKKDAIAAFPVQIISDISVQLIWFQDRVSNLFGLEILKNG